MRPEEFSDEDNERAEDFQREIDARKGYALTNFGFNQHQGHDKVTVRQLQTLADKIKKDCAPYIEANRSELLARKYLFRGVVGARVGELAITGTVRQDRKPRDTAKFWHYALDDYFEYDFGWRYRSASMFASPSQGLVADFGPRYIVFPIGNYTMCYSPIVEDITTMLGSDDLLFNRGYVSELLHTLPEEELWTNAKRFEIELDRTKARQELISLFALFADRTIRHAEFNKPLAEKFSYFLTRYFFPKLKYQETLSLKEIPQVEVMTKCDSFHGISTDLTYRTSGVNLQLMDMILS